ncbi:MAG: flagellar hook capping FlgD N-terminal domain-containing protein [Acidobacteriaceae bacterium]
MNILSIFHLAHAQSAPPFEASAVAAHGKSSTVTSNAATAGTNGSSGSSAGKGDSAAITANDFLTLLVTEIKNQDPTSQTDPMTYITQLVGVNSLQQLLQINQTLTTAVGPGGTLSGTGATPATGSSQSSHANTARSAATDAAVQGVHPATDAASGTGVLPMGANAQATVPSTNAVAQAFAHPAAMPPQVPPPTQVPLNPEVMRALENSIPGARPMVPGRAQ